MRTSFLLLAARLPLVLSALAMATFANCSCDQGIVVVDGFGDEDVAGDRLHTYAAGGRAEFTLRGSGITPDCAVVSSDEGVFRVVSVERRAVTALFQPDAQVLDVVIASSAAGEADLVVKSAAGDVIDTRALRFVAVDGVLLTRVVGLPGEIEGPIDMGAIQVAERGADLLVRFTAGDDDDVHGLDVFSFVDATLAHVDVQTVGSGTDSEAQVRTVRNFIHVAPVPEPTTFRYTLAGVAFDDAPIAAAPAAIATTDFVRKDELRALLADREVPADIVELLATGSDERVICDGDRCAAKIEPKDAAGRPVLGAPVNWQLPGVEEAVGGDIFVFERGDEEHTVRATLTAGDATFDEALTVRAKPDTLSVVTSTQAVSCAAFGESGVFVGVVGLLALRRRRR